MSAPGRFTVYKRYRNMHFHILVLLEVQSEIRQRALDRLRTPGGGSSSPSSSDRLHILSLHFSSLVDAQVNHSLCSFVGAASTCNQHSNRSDIWLRLERETNVALMKGCGADNPSKAVGLPEAVVEVVQGLYSDILIDGADVFGRHTGQADGSGILLSLCVDRHRLSRIDLIV